MWKYKIGKLRPSEFFVFRGKSGGIIDSEYLYCKNNVPYWSAWQGIWGPTYIYKSLREAVQKLKQIEGKKTKFSLHST